MSRLLASLSPVLVLFNLVQHAVLQCGGRLDVFASRQTAPDQFMIPPLELAAGTKRQVPLDGPPGFHVQLIRQQRGYFHTDFVTEHVLFAAHD